MADKGRVTLSADQFTMLRGLVGQRDTLAAQAQAITDQINGIARAVVLGYYNAAMIEGQPLQFTNDGLLFTINDVPDVHSALPCAVAPPTP